MNRLLCLLLFILPLAVQSQKADSLLQILPASTDTQRVKILNDLCWEFAFSNPDKGKLFGSEALKLAEELNYSMGKGKALNRLGVIYDVTGKYDSAIYCYQFAGVAFAQASYLKGKASAINNIGMLYAEKGNFSRALNNYFEALKIFESLPDQNDIANCLNNIGIVFSDIYKFNIAQRFFLRAASIYEKTGNNQALASCFTNIGRNYSDLEKQDSALYYFNRSLPIELRLNNQYGLGILYNNMAIAYKDLKQHQQALGYYFKALQIKKSLNDQTGEASTLLNIGSEYGSLKNKEMEEKYFQESHELALKLNSWRILRKSSYAMYYIAKQKGDYKKALEYLRLYDRAKDSTLNEESSKQISELETKYESEKKALELEKANLELTNANLEINQKRTTILVLGIAIAFLVVVALSVYNRYRHKQQKEMSAQLLQQQELRNKAIIEAEEKERIRIARELHDGIGQQLSAAKMNLSAFETNLDRQSKQQFDKVVMLVDEAVKEVRSISHNMMPNALLRSGLASAIRDFVHKINVSDALKVELQIVGLQNRLESTTETVLYRVLQECVSNIIKHANATQINIQLIQHNQHLNMLIEDNGVGFDVKTIGTEQEGIGIRNMISRVHFLSGTIDFDSTPAKGTTVIVDVPINTST